MTNHTPGPWKAQGDLVIAEASLEGNDIICELYDDRGAATNKEERDFNAYLIAAAPDMLEALKLAGKLIDDLMPGIRHLALQDYRSVNETPLAMAAAIRKTEGKE